MPNRLDRNAFAFIISALTTSFLGLGYWALAERWYTTQEIGKATAILAAMTLLANFGQFNLQTALIRVIPKANLHRSSIVRKSYLIGLTGSGLAAGIFLAGQRWWAPSLHGLRSGIVAPIGFVTLVMAWSVFVLQDSALAGLHRGDIVLKENVAFAVAKIVVLGVGVSLFRSISPIISWGLPLAVAIVFVNRRLFRNGGILTTASYADQESTPRLPVDDLSAVALVRLGLADYVSSLFWIATSSALPLVVLEKLGPIESAQYYLGWTLAYGLYLVSSNAYLALLAEGSADPSSLRTLSARSRKRVTAVIVPGALVACVVLPYVLRLFGKDYSSAVPGIRWMLLSAIPNVFVGSRITVLRVRRSVRSLIILQAGTCVMVLVLAVLFMGRFGITGVGLSWFAGQSIAALGAYVAERVEGKQSSAQRKVEALLPGAVLIPNGRRGTIVARGFVNDRRTILKLAPREQAGRIAAQVHAQLSIRELTNFEGRDLIPQAKLHTLQDGAAYLLEDCLEGISGELAVADFGAAPWLSDAVESAMRPIYSATQHHVCIEDQIARSVTEPFLVLRSSGIGKSSTEHFAAFGAIEQRLAQALSIHSLPQARVHGDLAPMNILVDALTQSVTGLIDWERSTACGSPAIELTHLRLTTECLRRNVNIGTVVFDVVTHKQDSMSLVPSKIDRHGIDGVDLVLLAWLHHVASNISKDPSYATAPLWKRKAIYPVLGAFRSSVSATSPQLRWL
jgi:O-antigen/teichoic acid export membrane protein